MNVCENGVLYNKKIKYVVGDFVSRYSYKLHEVGAKHFLALFWVGGMKLLV